MAKKPEPNNHLEKPILLGFATKSTGIDGNLLIKFRWGRIVLSLTSLAIAGWLVTAGALYFYFKYAKEYPEVKYTGMLTLPLRLEEHRKEMGDFHINKGLEQLKKEQYRDALRLLRLGVTRSPSNTEGRMVLAEFYEFILRRPDLAENMLVSGLEEGGIEDADYVKATVRMLLRNQMDDSIQTIADTYLPKTVEINDVNSIIAFGAANANYLRGNFDRADDYLYDYSLLNTLDGVLLSSKISWERNNQVAAITKLESSLAKNPNSSALLQQLSLYHREREELDEAYRYAILRNIISPMAAAPRIELLYIQNAKGESDKVKTEAIKLLNQFSDDEMALQQIANFAADTGEIGVARRAYEEALEREFKIDSFALLLIEAHLVEKDFVGAHEFAEELAVEKPSWLNGRSAAFNSLRAVTSYGMNRPDLGEIYLQEFLNENQIPANVSLAVSKRFQNIERPIEARKVLANAYASHRTNQKVLSEFIRSELTLGNTEQLSTLIARLLQMRRPEMDLLKEAYRKMGSDRFIFVENRDSILLELSAILRENSEIAAGS